MMEVNGLAPLDEPALLHFTQRQDMVAWAPSVLARHGSGRANER